MSCIICVYYTRGDIKSGLNCIAKHNCIRNSATNISSPTCSNTMYKALFQLLYTKKSAPNHNIPCTTHLWASRLRFWYCALFAKHAAEGFIQYCILLESRLVSCCFCLLEARNSSEFCSSQHTRPLLEAPNPREVSNSSFRFWRYSARRFALRCCCREGILIKTTLPI